MVAAALASRSVITVNASIVVSMTFLTKALIKTRSIATETHL